MSQENSTTHPVGRAILAIIALVVIVITGNMLVASLGVGHKTLDLTEDRVHSLSDGTKEILSDLSAPVEIRYYATRSSRYMPEQLKLHMRRVDDLLAEYENLADGKLRIEHLDPEPDTDAEDAANLDGISGRSINNENIYLGLAISCLDQTSAIPFLDPNAETMLEYEISRRIAEVSATRKPTIGVMSALDLAGSPPMGMGQRPTPPWVIYNQLSQAYEVEDLGMNPGEIDPEKYSLLLVMHPAGITPEAEFAIDQYVLGGGTVMACLDSFSFAARMTGGGNPRMGQQGTPTFSTLPTLLDAWGVEMNPSQVVGDPVYQTTMQGNRSALAVLTVPQDGMPQEDSIVTRDLTSVTFLLPGGFTKKGGAGLEMETLVQASSKAALVDSTKASRLDPSLSRNFQADPKRYDLVLRLSGEFKTAFPAGNPADQADESDASDGSDKSDKSDGSDGSDAADQSDAAKEPNHLTEASEPGNVFLISDVDAFYDNFAYDVRRLGNMQIAQAVNGNSALFFNLIDSAAASTHLIGARSRAATSRPFTVFQELETEVQERVGDRIAELEEEAQKAQQRINEMQAQRGESGRLYLSSEQESEIRKFREQEVEARRQIRELEKELRREKDQIAARIMGYNIAGIPCIILVVGLLLYMMRRRRTRARAR